MYRLNRQSEALDELTKCSKDTPGVPELRAQVSSLPPLSHSLSTIPCQHSDRNPQPSPTKPQLPTTTPLMPSNPEPRISTPKPQTPNQVLYRLGRYSESAKAYETLDSEAVDPAELAANRAAALTAAGDGAMAEKVITATANLVDMTPDMAYNKACSIIERGEWKQALKVRIRFQTRNVVGHEPIH